MSTREPDPRILVQPGIAWGRPHTARRGISTRVLWSRTVAGETVDHLAEDYDLAVEEVEAALAFERWCHRRGRYDAPYAERLAADYPWKARRQPRQVWPRRAW